MNLSPLFRKLRASFLLAMVTVFFVASANAQQSIATVGVAVTQDFNGLGSSATATLPTGWKMGTDWSTGATATGAAAGTSGTGALSSGSSGNFYNFASGITASSTDRAIGFLTTGSYSSPRSIIYAFQNNTGQTITSITLAWNYEKYRSGTRAFDWTFFHGSTSTASIAVADGNQSYAVDGAIAVVNPPTGVAKTITITGTSIAPGATYYLRWTYTGVGGSSNSQALGVDDFSITLSAAASSAPVITSPTTASAVAFEVSSNIYQITASNSPQSFGASNLPQGLVVDSATGIISGTLPGPGTYQITISATNSSGTGQEALTLTVAPNPGAPAITSSLQVVAPINQPFTYQILASNNPTSFAATGLPTGWAIDATTGVITGTPSSNVSRNFSITASNALGSDTKTLNVFTGDAPTLPNSFGAAYVNSAASLQIVATGPATSFSSTNLPAGWTLNSTNGLITGTPTSTGSFQFQVGATNPVGSTNGTFTITVLDQAAQNAIPLNVVVNKYVNGSPDRVQLLVVGSQVPGSTVDLRGMIIKDFSSSNGSDGGGKYIFADNEVWSAVPAGTFIDLLGPGALQPETPFVDPSNFYIAARLQDATAFVSGGGTLDIGANDMVMIKAAGTGVSGVAGGIHVVCAGSAGAQYDAFLGAKVKGGNAAPSAVVQNSTSRLADYGTSGSAASTDILVTVPEASLNFESWNNGTNESFVKALRGIVDGTGSAVVRNAVLGSPFNGLNLFQRGSSAQTLALNFTPVSSVTPITDLSIEVPVGFGTPLPSNVAVTGTGAGGATVDVTGQIITVGGLSAVSPNVVTVTVSGLITPDTSTPITNNGSYSFTVRSRGQGGTLTALSASPAALVTVPIANARNADPVTFVPVLSGQTLAVEGVCSVGRLGTGSTSSALQDATHGISIFSQSLVPGPQVRGNRYAVVGTLTQFNGLVQLTLADPTLVINLGAEGDPSPVTISVADLNTNGLAYQSRVIRITDLSYVSGVWSNNNTVTLRDAASNNVSVRIMAASTATNTPTVYPVNVTGIAGQSDAVSPFNEGFQLQPRDPADVVRTPVIVASGTLSSFSTPQGTPSASQSFNASGSGLTASIVVSAPTNFEVSLNNTNFASSVSLSPTSGSVASTPVFVRIASSATAGNVSGSVSLTSSGAATQTIAVSGTVTQAGETFTSWAQGAPLNSANLMLYAIGGATSPTASNGIAMSNAVTSSNLSITAIVRTNDPNLSVFGQSIVNLGPGTWSTNDVSRITNGVDQTGVPSGNQRQIFSTPRGLDGKKFLRLQTTLSNQ